MSAVYALGVTVALSLAGVMLAVASLGQYLKRIAEALERRE